MKVRLEPTKVKHLSWAQLWDRLLNLPPNIRKGWKSLPVIKTLTYNKNLYARKTFYNIELWAYQQVHEPTKALVGPVL